MKIKGKIMTKAKNIHEFIEKQKAALAANPDCGTTHYNLAIALMGLERYEEAKLELFAAIECSPNLAEAYVQLGGICLKNGDLEGCLHYNQLAVKSRAGFSEGYGNIGFVYLQLGEIEKAIPPLEKAIRWNPMFLQAYATLANAYLMQGDVDESIKVNLKALEVESNFAVAHNNLAIAYLQDENVALAAKHMEKAKELGYEVAPEILDEIEALKKTVK
jgi:tetratricopeptide (TPR) repeat protein